MAPLTLQFNFLALEAFRVSPSLLDQLLVVSLELGKLHLSFLELLRALLELELIFLEYGRPRVAKHRIEYLDAVIGLLWEHPAIYLLHNLFENVPLLQNLHKFFQRVLLEVTVLLQFKLCNLSLLMLILKCIISALLTLDLLVLAS